MENHNGDIVCISIHGGAPWVEEWKSEFSFESNENRRVDRMQQDKERQGLQRIGGQVGTDSFRNPIVSLADISAPWVEEWKMGILFMFQFL